MTHPEPSAAGRECAAGIVFALAVEADPLADLARDVATFEAGGRTLHEGLLAGRRVAWCAGGAGADAAARAARLLVAGHRPRVLVTAGFAGGLDAGLARGSLVRPRGVVNRDGGDLIRFAAVPDGIGAAAAPTIVSVDDVVTTAAAKRRLATATGAGLVDMESFAVALAAREAGLPCLAIRVVSDDAGADLPREVAALVRPQSGLRRLGLALGAIGRRPGAARDLWRLWEHACVDGRTLAAGLERLVAGISLTG